MMITCLSRSPLLCLLCAALAGSVLTGCSNVDGYKDPHALERTNGIKAEAAPITSVAAGSGSTAGQGSGGAGAADGGANMGAGAIKGNDGDYIEKSDIYWKLNAIKVGVTDGNKPANLDITLKQLSDRAYNTISDDKRPLMIQIIKLLQNAVEAEKMISLLQDDGVDPSAAAAPDSSSHTGSYMNNSLPDTPVGSSISSGGGVSGKKLLAEYERTHQSSPAEVKRFSYHQAFQMTERLGGMLGLLHRKANSKPGEIIQAE